MQPYAKKVALGSAIALSAGGGYLALNQRRPVLMEAYLKRDKLPIYPAPQPEIVLVETASDLETHIAAAREQTTGVVRAVREETQAVVSKWISVERKVAAHVNRIVPDDEPLTPGAAWVGVSTLAGSLVSRNRTFLLRLIAPPAFFLIALPYFLPKLSSNLAREASSTTAQRAPELHAQATALKRSTDEAFESAEDWLDDARETVGEAVGKTVTFVERTTGLQLYQAFESSFSRSNASVVPAHHAEGVTVSTKPVGSTTVPLFEQRATATGSMVPGTPVPAPGATTAVAPSQTVAAPVYRQTGGPASTTERLDAAAAKGLIKVEDKVAEGVQAAKDSDAAHAAERKAAEARDALSSLKTQAEHALSAAPGKATDLAHQAKDAARSAERKADGAVDVAQDKLASAAQSTRAEGAHLRDLAREAGEAAKAKAGEAKSTVKAEASDLRTQGAEVAHRAEDKAADVRHDAGALVGTAKAKVDELAYDAKVKAQAALQAAEAKAGELKAEGASLLHQGEDKARAALSDAEAKANRAAGAVKAEAKDVQSAAAVDSMKLKVDEQTVDGKKQGQPPVVGLLAGRERESGYKKLV